MRGVLAAAPFYLVDLFLDLQGFEVVELGLVGLEFGVELVFARFLLHATGLGRSGGREG